MTLDERIERIETCVGIYWEVNDMKELKRWHKKYKKKAKKNAEVIIEIDGKRKEFTFKDIEGWMKVKSTKQETNRTEFFKAAKRAKELL